MKNDKKLNFYFRIAKKRCELKMIDFVGDVEHYIAFNRFLEVLPVEVIDNENYHIFAANRNYVPRYILCNFAGEEYTYYLVEKVDYIDEVIYLTKIKTISKEEFRVIYENFQKEIDFEYIKNEKRKEKEIVTIEDLIKSYVAIHFK